VTDGFAIEADADRTIDIPPIQVPWSTPVTMGGVEVWIQSGLDIDWALDPSDEDQLTVEPGARLQSVLDAMDQLGFGLRTTRNEEAETQFAPHPFVQRFLFRGGAEPFAGKLDAVHLTPIPARPDEDLLVLMTVDRIGEREIGDKRRGRFTVSTDDVDAIADRLHDKIESRL
jgi:sporulation-control protein